MLATEDTVEELPWSVLWEDAKGRMIPPLIMELTVCMRVIYDVTAKPQASELEAETGVDVVHAAKASMVNAIEFFLEDIPGEYRGEDRATMKARVFVGGAFRRDL